MKQIFLNLSLFSIFFMLINTGCKKEEDVPAFIDSKTEFRSLIDPEVENGILKFKTHKEAFRFLTELSDVVDKDDPENTSGILNYKAINFGNTFKEKYNFTPLLNKLKKDELGFLSEYVFPDNAMNLIMNEHSEILIGDSIYVHKNTSEYYVIKNGDDKNREVLKSLPLNIELPVDKINNGIKIVGNGRRVIVKNPIPDKNDKVKPRSINPSECLCVLSLSKDETGNPPPGQTNYILTYHCEGLSSTSQWRIEWPLFNPPVSDLTGLASMASTGTINFTGNDNFGDMKFKFYIQQNCGYGSKEYCYDISINTSNVCCSKNFTASNGSALEQTYIIPNSGIKLIGKLESGIGVFGYVFAARIECRSVATNGYLYGDLQQWLNIKSRNSISNQYFPCGIFEEDSDYDACNNCRWNSENIYLNGVSTHHKLGDGRFDFKGKRAGHSGFLSIEPKWCN